MGKDGTKDKRGASSVVGVLELVPEDAVTETSCGRAGLRGAFLSLRLGDRALKRSGSGGGKGRLDFRVGRGWQVARGRGTWGHGPRIQAQMPGLGGWCGHRGEGCGSRGADPCGTDHGEGDSNPHGRCVPGVTGHAAPFGQDGPCPVSLANVSLFGDRFSVQLAYRKFETYLCHYM